ncbi:hypothetical protein CIB48_g9168 [Xylaria polymorpha]|nr:hypothetical protein CIB48_g9168 [Xylaria polymorpha]
MAESRITPDLDTTTLGGVVEPTAIDPDGELSPTGKVVSVILCMRRPNRQRQVPDEIELRPLGHQEPQEEPREECMPNQPPDPEPNPQRRDSLDHELGEGYTPDGIGHTITTFNYF